MQDNKWVSLKEAAGFLGVDYLTLYRMARRGQIKHLLTPARRYRFNMQDLLDFQAVYPMYKKPETDPVNLE